MKTNFLEEPLMEMSRIADKLQEENERLKLDNAKLQEKYNLVYQENQMNIIKNKEREKNYLRTNSMKDKRIKELEQQLYSKNNSQRSLFNER